MGLFDSEEKRLTAPVPSDNPYDAAAASVAEKSVGPARAAIRGASGSSPDTYAEAKRISATTGIPADVAERNMPDAKREAETWKYDALLKQDPGFAEQLANTDLARLAPDEITKLAELRSFLSPQGAFGKIGGAPYKRQYDLKPTTGPEPTLQNYVMGLLGNMNPAASEGTIQGIRQQFADLFGLKDMAADATRKAAAAKTQEILNTPAFETGVARNIYGGLASAAQQLPLLPLAFAAPEFPVIAALGRFGAPLANLVGRSWPVLAAFGVKQETQKYSEYRAADVPPAWAGAAALGSGATEVLTELAPMSFLVSRLGKIGAGEFLAGLVGREMVGEQFATHIEDAIDTATLNPEMTWAQYAASRPSATISTVISTFTQAAAMGGAALGARKLLEQAHLADQAAYSAAQLQQLKEFADGMNLPKRDVPTFTQFVNDAAAQGPVDSVYINATMFQQAAQAAGVDLKTTMPETAAALDEAVAAKTDVRIPLGEFAANSTLFQPEIVQHLKTDANGATLAETQDKEWVEATKQATEKILAQGEFNDAIRQSTETVKAELKAQLDAANRFTSEVNDAKAGYAAAMYKVLAVKHNITPEEAYVRWNIDIASQNFEGANVLTQPAATLQDFAPGAVRDILQKDNWAILTAENPNAQPLTPEENAVRMDNLRAALKAEGVPFTEVKGKYGNEENSLLLTGVTPQRALELGQQFGQESVLTKHGLIYQDGTVTPATGVTEHTTPPEDFYSVVPETGAAFSVDLDFDAPRTVFGQSAAKRISDLEKWAGKTKIRNPDGSLQPWYHGTARDITVFEPKQAGAIFLTRNPAFAEGFAYTSETWMWDNADQFFTREQETALWAEAQKISRKNKTDLRDEFNALASSNLPSNANIMPLYVKAENPFDYENDDHVDALVKFAADSGNALSASDIAGLREGVWSTIEKPEVQILIEEKGGHDAFYVLEGGEKNLAVYRSNQLKSVFNKTPTDSPNILMQAGVVKNMTPAISRLLANLTPNERQKITDNTAAKVIEQLEMLPSADEMAAVAFAGRAKRGWYEESARAISDIFGWDAPHFAALLAALSPQTSVEINLRNTLRTWKAWDAAGRPRDRATIVKILGENVEGTGTEKSVLNAWINNAVHALQDIDALTSRPLSGAKVNSFYMNLLGNVNEVTLDAWMANYALIDQNLFQPSGNAKKKLLSGEPTRDPGKGFTYLAYVSRVREAAARLTKFTGETWTPAEVQETVWSWAKTLYEKANSAGSEKNAHQLVLDDALTNELLTSTPDFANLFNEPRYASILQDAGYGQQLEELSASRRDNARQPGQDDEPGAARETTPFDRATQKRHEARAAKRLDKLAAAGGKKAVFGQSSLKLPEYGQDVPGSISVVGVHFSKEARGVLLSSKMGTGMAGAEQARAPMQRINFYVNQGSGVTPERDVGAIPHAVRLNGLYDASADRLNLFKTGDLNEREQAVVSHGFSGYYSRNFSNGQGAAVLLGQHAVEARVLDSTKAITEVPPPRDATPERELAEALVAVKGLPNGQMSGPEWVTAMWKAAPQIASQIPETALATLEAHTDLMYRDEVARTFYQRPPEVAKFLEGSAVQQIVYHGTTAEVAEFDYSKANVESDLGAAFYFTDTREDVAKNYAGFGPDLTNKIEQRAEELMQEWYAESREPAYGTPKYKRDAARARKAATKEFGTHGGMTIPVYLSMKDPFVVGGAKNTFLDYSIEQDDGNGDYTGDETGALVDFIVALRNIASRYEGGSVDDVVGKLVEQGMDSEGVSAADLMTVVKNDEWFGYYINDNGKLVSNEIVRQALQEIGFDGIIDHTVNKKFGSEAKYGKMAGMTVGTTHFVVFDHKQIMSALSGQVMQGADKPRGQISFGSDIRATPSVLTLLANADLSTFHHELAHFYLEILSDVASQPDAPPEMVRDMEITLKWFGVKDLAAWNAMSLEAKRPFHEMFARGHEMKLFEGKSPSLELSSMYARFRSWIMNVYQDLKKLDVVLTDEVRGVYDRMVATNDEILQAETARTFAPLYETKPEGMTDAEWGDYHVLGGDATQEAVDQLQTRSLRDMQYASNAKSAALKRLQRHADALRKGVRAEVAAEVETEPIYQVMRFLKTGVYEGESAGTYTRHRLDIATLDTMYPADMTDRPPLLNLAQMRGFDGIAPDVVAQMFGYGSGDVLVRELLNTEPMQNKIAGLTDQRMLERYGDLADPASMEKAANAAVHNDVRAKFIATELRTLEKAAGNKVTLSAMAREFAATLIARKKIRTIRPAIYAAAAAKAAKNADTAFRKDDVPIAAGEKRNQLVNVYAARFAADAIDEVEKTVAYLKRVGESKSIDPEYRAQITGLLERFDLRKVSQREVASRQSLLQWMEAQREKGFEPAIDPALENEALRKSYQEMTLEEFRGLTDSIKNIEHLGRLKSKLLKMADSRAFAVVVNDVTASIHNYAKRTLPHETEAQMSARKQILALHTKMSSFMRQLDGWLDNGIMQRLFIHSSNAAGAQEALMHEQATIRLIELFQPLLKNESLQQKAGRTVTPFGLYTGYMGEKTFIPEINESLSREARLMVALNVGNEGNLQRLMDGDHWTDKQVQAVVDTLTKQEMDFVQSVWDFVGEYKSPIGEQQKRLTGVEPTWIEPRQVVTKHGVYAGGYLPAKYNGAMSSRSLSNEAAANLTDALRATRGSAAARASFTKERAAKVINRPLRKDFGVITQHVTEVTHRLAWQEWLVDANRLLRAAPVDQAIRKHYGPEILESIRENITAIAAGNVGAQNALERGVNYLRTGATIAGLGWRLTTSLLQPIGLTQSMVRIGPKWVGKGLVEFLGDAAHMESSYAKITAKSEMMRLRGKTMQREISEIQDTVTGEGGAIKASFFYLIQKMQLVADIPTWLGAYHKAIATSGLQDPAAVEANAVAQADQAVLDAQGSGQVKDLPAVLRGTPYLKLWTNFASFFIGTTFQLTREAVGRTDFKSPAGVLMLAVDFLLLYTLPAALGTLMKYALSDDDDEDKLIRTLISDQLSYMLGTMIGLRELGSAARSAVGLPGDYGGPAGGRILGELTRLGKQIQQGEADEALFKAMNNSAGVVFHYPAGQIGATADGIAALANGKTANPGVLAVGSSKR